jgi:hypothetical protein
MKAVFITPEKSTSGFEPLMWLIAQEMIQTLRSLGVEIRPVTVNVSGELSHTAHEIMQFKPDFVTAPNFNYFLAANSNGNHIFRSLERPVVALWDDPLGALANFFPRQSPTTGPGATHKPMEYLQKFVHLLARRTTSIRKQFRNLIGNPLMRHFAWDSGHIETLDSLGLLTQARVRWYPLMTYSPFLRAGAGPKEVRQTTDVAFCGNIYLSLVSESGFWKDDFFRELTIRICDRKAKTLNRSVWSVMMEEIGNLRRKTRRRYELDVDSRPFWDYYVFTVWYAANTLVRLGILGSVQRQVSIHGVFADPKSVEGLKNYPNLSYKGIAHFFNDLPEVYASTRINICISNGLIYNGIPSKLIDCLASGGFALTDPKEDLVRLFGSSVETIFFRNADQLNSKVEYYLAHPHEREEIVSELRDKIRRKCTLKALFEQVLESVKG